MKKVLSIVLSMIMLMALLIPAIGVSAENEYTGKTVILYTGNIRGDIDVYAKIATVKKNYESKGATVILVDAGNYLQGKTYANSDRGLGVYNLMDAAKYDVANMGQYDFCYGDATTGYKYHSNYYEYFTQKELLNGVAAKTVNQNYSGTVTYDRAEKNPATFKVVSSNVTANSNYYSFETNTTITANGKKVIFYGITDPGMKFNLQDGFVTSVADPSNYAAAKGTADYSVCLTTADVRTKADITIKAVTDGAMVCGAYVIAADGTITEETVNLASVTADADIVNKATPLKNAAKAVLGTSSVTLNGADSINWNQETNLGDLTTDALKWYAENKIEGLTAGIPVVAIQNGGNCDNFLYKGDINETDLLKSLPFSPMGVGVLKVTGAQLLETLEAACQKENCPGFAQVAGIEYTIDSYKVFNAGDAYNEDNGFYKADSINRVTITKVNGTDFKEDAVYYLVTDNFLMNGNDTYYTLKDIKTADASLYINNGNGVKTRDVVAKYIAEVLGGNIGAKYAEPQGRITINTEALYIIVEGDKAQYVVGSGKDMTFKFDGDLQDFTALKIDDKVVDNTNYTLEAGSTIVTLKADYVATLAKGSHTIEAVYGTYGSAKGTFTIADAAVTGTGTTDKIADTADTTNIALGVFALALGGVGVYGCTKKSKED